MKKNMLKYCLILLTTFFFCAKAMSQIHLMRCDDGTSEALQYQLYCPAGDIPPAYTRIGDKTYYLVIAEDTGENCVFPSDNSVEGLDPFWWIELPLDNGTILLSLLIMGYGVFLYYRRKPLHV